MKKVAWILGLGLGGLVVWWKRHELIPTSQAGRGPTPAFRTTKSPDPAATDRAAAREPEPGAGAAPDDLQKVNGIGPVYAARLAEHGVTSFAALCDADADEIAEVVNVATEAVDDWKQQAADLI